MKVARKTIIPVILLGVGLLIGTVISTYANTGLISSDQPGSIEDPIVTKSYVDQRLAELGFGEVEDGKTLTVVEMSAGHSLIAFEGTEFIVRTGRAVGFSQTTDGIPDLTDGKDIKAGTRIPNNHLLLFPRSDGRGIRHEGEEVFVMIRGAYQHLDGNGHVIAEKRP